MVLIHTTCRDLNLAAKAAQDTLIRKLATEVEIYSARVLGVTANGIETQNLGSLWISTNESKVQDIEDMLSIQSEGKLPFVGVLDLRRVNREYKEYLAKTLS